MSGYNDELPPPAPPPAAALPPAPAAAPPAPAPAAEPGAIQANAPSPDGGGATGLPPAPIDPDAFVRGAHLADQDPTPVTAMFVAGPTVLQRQTGPGQNLEQHVPALVQGIVEARGPERTGPLTRADYATYLTEITLSAQRNLSPRDQVSALAAIDNIRSTGMRQFGALAVAASEAGDMEGAARALNGMNNFMPDGYTTQFTATPNGVEMTRQREGENGRPTGEPSRVTVPAAAVTRYATAMLDPTWSLNHALNTAKHEETVRHGMATEDIGRQRNAISAAGVAQAAAARREDKAGNAAALRTAATLDQAEQALHELPTDATDDQRKEARDRIAAARAKHEEALGNAGSAGVEGSSRVLNTGRDNRRGEQQHAQTQTQARTQAERDADYTRQTSALEKAERDAARVRANEEATPEQQQQSESALETARQRHTEAAARASQRAQAAGEASLNRTRDDIFKEGQRDVDVQRQGRLTDAQRTRLDNAGQTYADESQDPKIARTNRPTPQQVAQVLSVAPGVLARNQDAPLDQMFRTLERWKLGQIAPAPGTHTLHDRTNGLTLRLPPPTGSRPTSTPQATPPPAAPGGGRAPAATPQ